MESRNRDRNRRQTHRTSAMLPLDGRGLAELVLRLVNAVGASPDEAAPLLARGLRRSGGLAERDAYWARLWTRAALRHWQSEWEAGVQVAARAVLRAARTDAALAAMPYEVPFLFLEQRASLPPGKAADWLQAPREPHRLAGVSRALWGMLPADERDGFLRAAMQEPPLTVRVRGGVADLEACAADLAAEGFRVLRNPHATAALDLVGERHLFGSPRFLDGSVEVQDASSQQLCEAIAQLLPAGASLLDLCAGRGGKSLALAALRPDLRVFATDISDGRLSELPVRAARAGCTNLRVVPGMAAAPAQRHEPFDLVLLDAPCTGLGTLRRHPELRLRDIDIALREARAGQRAVIASGWERTRPGGLLVYATCSVLPAENDEAVAEIAAKPDALEIPLPPPAGGDDGRMRRWPHHDGTDGFFAAAFRRRG